MKTIGIVFAMDEELRELKKYLIITNEKDIYDLHFIEAKCNKVKCILVESGVGKVNSAHAAQVMIDNYKIDYIFNIGVAGGLTDTLEIGDIIIGDKLVQHDFDITAFNHNKGYIPKIGDYVESDKDLLLLATTALSSTVKVGTIASGDIFCTDKKMSENIYKEFNALCVEMEGASVAQVAKLCNKPFLIIRSISDKPNNNNKITYEEFLEESSKKVAKVMNDLINNI